MKITSLLKLSVTLVILALIGIIRVILQVQYKIFLDDKWFSFDPDILFTMACYPVYLCFFMFMCLHLILKLFKVHHKEEQLISFFFWIQLMHLLIPFLDAIGFRYNIPCNMHPYLNAQGMSFGFSLNPFANMKSIWSLPIYFTPLLLLFTRVTTFGINMTWFLVSLLFLIFLRKKIKIDSLASFTIFFLMFQILYWPVYKYYFIFDRLFNQVTGIARFTHYGYGTYFLIFGAIGVIYFWVVTHKRNP